jgi:hypothetical protein
MVTETVSPYFLIYASTAARDFAEGELLELLTQARTFNDEHDITGLLLYSPGEGGEKGTFVQFLEGNRRNVQSLYVRISRDHRHTDCTLLKEGTHFQRRFAEWTMGFRDLSAVKPQDVPGFNPIYLRHWTLTQVLAEPDPILQLLYSFAGV